MFLSVRKCEIHPDLIDTADGRFCICLQKEDVGVDLRADAELAMPNVDVAIHAELLRDTAPVLDGIKV